MLSASALLLVVAQTSGPGTDTYRAPAEAPAIFASGEPRIGIGVQTALSGLSFGIGPIPNVAGPTLSYDAGDYRFDVTAAFGYLEDTGTQTVLAGRARHVLHRGQQADFALGVGVMMHHLDTGPATSSLFLEGSAQIRVFLSDEVALTGATSLAAGFSDFFVLGVGGLVGANFGLLYYF